jgi:hypothetical protein
VELVLTEPKEYNSGHFGSIPTDTTSELSGMLYNVAQKYNIPREAYASIIEIINDKIIPEVEEQEEYVPEKKKKSRKHKKSKSKKAQRSEAPEGPTKEFLQCVVSCAIPKL